MYYPPFFVNVFRSSVFLFQKHLHQIDNQLNTVKNNHNTADAVKPCKYAAVNFTAENMYGNCQTAEPYEAGRGKADNKIRVSACG